MDWTVADFQHANHNPIADVNGQTGISPIFLETQVGKSITLDATRSRDPGGQNLQFHWFHYGEAAGSGANLASIQFSGDETPKASVTPTAVCRGNWQQAAPKCTAMA